MRLALAGVGALFLAILFATCGACRRSPDQPPAAAGSASAQPSATTSGARLRVAASAAGVIDPMMWSHARKGDVESLQTLAVHEGASGLVEAAEVDASLRPIAIRAMAYAEGWAQTPYLARRAAEADDDEARLALDSVHELAARRRTNVDVEDVEELAEGCGLLIALGKDGDKPRWRRVHAIRALRMMPCPKPEDIPSDLDAK
ncbi:MAG: hypothetical protein KIT84_21930 [Labilithrix sp.]|nr:hypothetical protein [Labilithrix sp.]MCW5813704.1 hypothetical protein [Labilithrix sp.]